MEEVEIIRCEIKYEIYERQIILLFEQLLKIDEAMQKTENEPVPELERGKAA